MSAVKQSDPILVRTILTGYEYRRFFVGLYYPLKMNEQNAENARCLYKFRKSFDGIFLKLLERLLGIAKAGRTYKKEMPFKPDKIISEIVSPYEGDLWDTLVEYCEYKQFFNWPSCTRQQDQTIDERWSRFTEALFVFHSLLKRCHDDVSLFDLDRAMREFSDKLLPFCDVSRKCAVAELKAALPPLKNALTAVSRAFYAYEIELKKENAVQATPARALATVEKVRSSKSKRGPKNTALMQKQRKAVRDHLDVDCHRPVASVKLEDCAHVWNLPENKKTWDAGAKRHDLRRGYSDHKALCNAVRREAKQSNRRN